MNAYNATQAVPIGSRSLSKRKRIAGLSEQSSTVLSKMIRKAYNVTQGSAQLFSHLGERKSLTRPHGPCSAVLHD